MSSFADHQIAKRSELKTYPTISNENLSKHGKSAILPCNHGHSVTHREDISIYFYIDLQLKISSQMEVAPQLIQNLKVGELDYTGSYLDS